MKKTISKLLGTGFVAASVFGFVSCSDPVEYDAKSDTVYSLDAPSVSAKAYPGVNYISWEPVTSASGYALYRVKDGDVAKLRKVTSGVTCYADIATSDHVLSDGKEYKYIVEAISTSDPANREVYAKNSQGSASVKAVVPAAGSAAISAEPTGSGKDFIKKYYEKLVTKASENVTFSIKDGFLYAEYPATAGFKYGVTVLPKGQYDALGDSVVGVADTENYKEDYKAELKTAVKTFGEHEVFLKVASVSELYTPVVVKLGSCTVEDIGESTGISSVVAEYIASKTAVVSWKPATLKATGKNSPVTNFKVYRTSDADSTWTALSAEVKEGQKSSDVGTGTVTISEGYYITDTVEDDSINYTYYVVHTDGTHFGSYDTGTLSGVSAVETEEPTLSVEKYVGSTTGANTIKITSTKDNGNQTLALSYVKLAEDANGDAVKYIPSNFTSLALENNNGYKDSYINYIENAAAGTYLVKLTASEDGKKDNSVYKIVVVDSADVNVATLSVSTDKTKVTVTETIAQDSKTDSVSNYKYTLYKVVATTSKDYTNSVSVVTTSLGEVALAYASGITAYCTKDIADIMSSETNVTTVYYVVKALASDSSVYAKKSNL